MIKNLFVIFALLSLLSCDQVKQYSQDALDVFGFSTTKPKAVKKSDKAKPPVTPQKEAAADAPKTLPDPAKKSDELVVKKEDAPLQQDQKTDLKNATAPEFKVDAPVNVKRRIGGTARYIATDGNYYYLDFPQHFAVYDLGFNELARNPVAFPVKRVTREIIDGKIYFYLAEENNVFEIFRLDSKVEGENKSLVLADVKSFEVGGKFYWMNAKKMAVFLEDKVQFLDLTDLANIKVLGEISLANASDGIAFGKYLYVAQNEVLNVVDTDAMTLLSSVHIGKNFGFLGLDEQKGKRLILSHINNKDEIVGIQYLNLAPDASGVIDFAEVLSFGKPLIKVSLDLPQQLLLGRESTGDDVGPLVLYSLANKRFLRGNLSTETNIIAWYLNSGKILLVNPKGISANTIKLNPEVIAKFKTVQKAEGANINTPLAQIGAQRTVLDEYEIKQDKFVELMSDSDKVVLLDENHFLVFEKSLDQKSHRVFASENFNDPDFSLNEIKPPEPALYDKILPTDFGVLSYTQATNKIQLIDVNFHFQTLPLPVSNLLSWFWFTSPQGEVLILSSKKNEIKNPLPYVVQIYLLKSPQQVELQSQLEFADTPFAFQTNDDGLVVLTPGQINVYDLDDLKKPELQKDDTVIFGDRKYEFKDIKVSPVGDKVFALFEQDQKLRILALSTKDWTTKAMMDEFEITPEQFSGASFSKGGQLLILPSQNGTLFYDVKDLRLVKEAAHWPLPSKFVDVTNKGQYMCVALGAQGVYCGELLF